MNKKAQAQIIVTVLIILIVLGIIAFVGNFLTRTVREGTEQAEAKVECLEIGLVIKNTEDGTNVTVERSAGGPDTITAMIYVEGDQIENSSMAPLESFTTTTTAVTTGQEVQVAAGLEDGTLCDFADSITVA